MSTVRRWLVSGLLLSMVLIGGGGVAAAGAPALQTTNLTGTWRFTLAEPAGSVRATVDLVDTDGVVTGSLLLPFPRYGLYDVCPVTIAGTYRYASLAMTWTAGGACRAEALGFSGLAGATTASGLFTTALPALPGGAWSAVLE